MTTRYQKRHYEDVAVILRAAVNEAADEGKMASRYMDDTTVENLIQDFDDLFAADNPLFDRARFQAACGSDCG